MSNPATQKRSFLHQGDGQILTGQIQRGTQAGYPPADDKGVLLRLKADGFQRVEQTRLGNAGGHQVHSLVGGALFVVWVRPGILFAQTHVVIEERIKTSASYRATEGLFMQSGRAGPDNDTVDA